MSYHGGLRSGGLQNSLGLLTGGKVSKGLVSWDGSSVKLKRATAAVFFKLFHQGKGFVPFTLEIFFAPRATPPPPENYANYLVFQYCLWKSRRISRWLVMIGAAGENFSLCCIILSSLPSELVHLAHCQRFSGTKVRQFPYHQGKTKRTKILYPGGKHPLPWYEEHFFQISPR